MFSFSFKMLEFLADVFSGNTPTLYQQFKNFFFTAGSTEVFLLLTARDVLVLQGNHPVRLVLHSPEQK